MLLTKIHSIFIVVKKYLIFVFNMFLKKTFIFSLGLYAVNTQELYAAGEKNEEKEEERKSEGDLEHEFITRLKNLSLEDNEEEKPKTNKEIAEEKRKMRTLHHDFLDGAEKIFGPSVRLFPHIEEIGSEQGVQKISKIPNAKKQEVYRRLTEAHQRRSIALIAEGGLTFKKDSTIDLSGIALYYYGTKPTSTLTVERNAPTVVGMFAAQNYTLLEKFTNLKNVNLNVDIDSFEKFSFIYFPILEKLCITSKTPLPEMRSFGKMIDHKKNSIRDGISIENNIKISLDFSTEHRSAMDFRGVKAYTKQDGNNSTYEKANLQNNGCIVVPKHDLFTRSLEGPYWHIRQNFRNSAEKALIRRKLARPAFIEMVELFEERMRARRAMEETQRENNT